MLQFEIRCDLANTHSDRIFLCLRFSEPVLLVGETGIGKTQITQTLARILQRALVIVNCHLNTETSDFLGGLRPARRKQRSGTLNHP